MADDIPVNNSQPYGNPGVEIFVWEGLKGGKKGKAINVTQFGDKNVQLGCAGGNDPGDGAVTFEGTGDSAGNPDHPDYESAVFVVLKDSFGQPITRSSNPLNAQVMQNPAWVRPAMSGTPDGGDMDVTLTCTPRR